MAYTRTMSELETEIRYRADIGSATARHSQSQVFALIRSSLQSLRALLTDAGSMRFVSRVALDDDYVRSDIPGAIGLQFCDAAGSGATALIVESIRSIRIKWGGQWRELRRVSIEEMLDHASASSLSRDPEVWADAGCETVGRPDTSGFRPGTRAVYVAPWGGGYDGPSIFGAGFIALGVYGVGALTATTDEVSLEQYGYEWLVADVGIKIATRDNDSQERAQLLMAARQDAERRMLATIYRERSPVVQRREISLWHRRGE